MNMGMSNNVRMLGHVQQQKLGLWPSSMLVADLARKIVVRSLPPFPCPQQAACIKWGL